MTFRMQNSMKLLVRIVIKVAKMVSERLFAQFLIIKSKIGFLSEWLLRESHSSFRSGKKRVGFYITTSGALRLLEHGIRYLLKDSDVEIIIIFQEKSWSKKASSSHEDLLRTLKEEFSERFNIAVLPEEVSRSLRTLTRHWSRNREKLRINDEFFERNYELSKDFKAWSRSAQVHKKFRNTYFPWLSSNSTKGKSTDLSRLPSGYRIPPLKKFINNLDIDILIYAPIVNSMECEVVCWNAPRNIINIGIVLSWDNLTIKGQLLDLWDQYAVWGSGQSLIATRFHEINPLKIEVLGPYPFLHLTNTETNGENTTRNSLVWTFSSNFIANEEEDFFPELEDVSDFLKEISVRCPDLLSTVQFRLHPNSRLNPEETRKILLSRNEGLNLGLEQFHKEEPVTSRQRLDYVRTLLNSRALIGYATSVLVEGAFLGIRAVAPPTQLARESYSGLWHGRLLTRQSGGPVLVCHSWDQFFEEIVKNEKYTPTGDFADFVGSSINPHEAGENFRKFILKLYSFMK